MMLYAVYLYFQGLSLRNVADALEGWVKRSHVSVWRWIQRFSRLAGLFGVEDVECFLVDGTQVQVGGQETWLWVAAEPTRRRFLGFYLSRTRSILVAELLLQSLVERYGKRPVYADGAPWCVDACRSLNPPHRVQRQIEEPGGALHPDPEGSNRVL